MLSEHYQVLIIGGGIQGCAVAQASAAAGFSTLLIEQEQWGWATSSRSTKLIHGGLRYLQTGQFKLVRECLQEREWMLEYLPKLVKRNWFYIPIYQDSHYRPWQMHAGLFLYFALTGFNKNGLYKRIPQNQWHTLSGIRRENLQAVFAYQDAQTDDREMTCMIKDNAITLGATCLEHTQFLKAEKHNTSYQVDLQEGDTSHRINADLIINASGPWVNQVIEKISPTPKQVEVDFVQGSHIVIEERISERCFYLEAPSDQRAVFVLPWKDKTLIGTTETPYRGKPEDSEPLQSEVDYLLHTVQHYFPEKTLTLCEQWSGLRVLPRTNEVAFFRPRDVMITKEEGMLSIYGGKLTAWRSTAEAVLTEIEKQLGVGRKVDTRILPMHNY